MQPSRCRAQPPGARTVALEPRRPLRARLGRREAREELCGRDRRVSSRGAPKRAGTAQAGARSVVALHLPPGGRGFWFQSTCRRRRISYEARSKIAAQHSTSRNATSSSCGDTPAQSMATATALRRCGARGTLQRRSSVRVAESCRPGDSCVAMRRKTAQDASAALCGVPDGSERRACGRKTHRQERAALLRLWRRTPDVKRLRDGQEAPKQRSRRPTAPGGDQKCARPRHQRARRPAPPLNCHNTGRSALCAATAVVAVRGSLAQRAPGCDFVRLARLIAWRSCLARSTPGACAAASALRAALRGCASPSPCCLPVAPARPWLRCHVRARWSTV